MFWSHLSLRQKTSYESPALLGSCWSQLVSLCVPRFSLCPIVERERCWLRWRPAYLGLENCALLLLPITTILLSSSSSSLLLELHFICPMSSSNVSQTTTATKSSQHGQFKSIPEAWEHYNAEHHPVCIFLHLAWRADYEQNTRHNGENNPYAKAPGDLHSFVPKDPSSGWTQQQKPWQLLHRDDEKMLWHCPETQTHHITRRAALTKQEQHQVHKSFPPAWAQQYEPLVNYVVPDPHDKYKRRNSLVSLLIFHWASAKSE